MPLRTVIVDDEPLARRGIELRLAGRSEFQIVAQCENGREALQACSQLKPDLMFLDIQMPGMSGLDVLERLPHGDMPLIVFVTAFDKYALDAFDAQALDYLLKPINDQRFEQALERVRAHWLQRNAVQQREKLLQLLAATRGSSILEKLLPEDESGLRYAHILPIRDEGGTVRLEVSSIDWIDAAGDYMCIHAQGKTYVLRETMKSLEDILDPAVFQRVHRSTIVNVHRVRRLRPHTNGEYYLILDRGQEIKLSRSYRDRVDQWLSRQ